MPITYAGSTASLSAQPASAQAEQDKQQKLGFQLGGPATVALEEARREPWQGERGDSHAADEAAVLNGGRSALDDHRPRSVMKQAANTILP